MSLCGSIWVLFPSMVGEVVPPRKASIGFGTMNGLTMILSSLATPIYGGLVDITGSFFVPNIISLGLGVFTLIILFIFLKETYGNANRE
jgi:MFS family permease